MTSTENSHSLLISKWFRLIYTFIYFPWLLCTSAVYWNPKLFLIRHSSSTEPIWLQSHSLSCVSRNEWFLALSLTGPGLLNVVVVRVSVWGKLTGVRGHCSLHSWLHIGVCSCKPFREPTIRPIQRAPGNNYYHCMDGGTNSCYFLPPKPHL